MILVSLFDRKLGLIVHSNCLFQARDNLIEMSSVISVKIEKIK